MAAIILTSLCLVLPGWFGPTDRDKTGTSRWKVTSTNKKALENQGFSEARSFNTERGGFEPPERFYPLAALAKRCFRPLSHLSRWAKP